MTLINQLQNSLVHPTKSQHQLPDMSQRLEKCLCKQGFHATCLKCVKSSRNGIHKVELFLLRTKLLKLASSMNSAAKPRKSDFEPNSGVLAKANFIKKQELLEKQVAPNFKQKDLFTLCIVVIKSELAVHCIFNISTTLEVPITGATDVETPEKSRHLKIQICREKHPKLRQASKMPTP